MNYSEIQELLSSPKKIFITSHKNPDGDALGSTLGLKHFLEALGHTCTVVYPTEYPSFLDWMPGLEDAIVPQQTATSETAKFGAHLVDEAELIFCLDFNDLRRIDAVGHWITKSNAPKVLIDHHINPHDFADYMLSEVSASSTCELVYDFIIGVGRTDVVNRKIVECLLTGILTDTGSFSFATSPKLFRTVAALQEAHDVDYNELHNKVFNNDTEKRIRLLGHCLSSAMYMLPEYHSAVILLTQGDFRDFDIQRGDTEGIVNFMLRIANVKFATLITDQKGIIKFSFRSKGGFNVQEFSNRHFGGGGHKNASGGEAHLSISQAWVRFRKALDEYEELKIRD